jgi:hypothetical protein
MGRIHRAHQTTAELELANKLVDIGFKSLAKKLHPDMPGGSTEEMSRLIKVRNRLKWGELPRRRRGAGLAACPGL